MHGRVKMKAPVPEASVQSNLYNKAVDAIRVINDYWGQDGFIAGFNNARTSSPSGLVS